MKTHPINKSVQGISCFPDRFIFGDAVPKDNTDPYECLVHTEQPAFCCRMTGNDQTLFFGRERETFASAMIYDKDNNTSYYVCNSGFRLFDFYFYGAESPSASELKSICDDAMDSYQYLNFSYDQPINTENIIEVWQKKYLSAEQINKQTSQLIKQANTSNSKDQKTLDKLKTQIAKALNSGNQEIFNEAQLSLINNPEKRNLLLTSANELITQNELIKIDDETVLYHLWAFPLIFSRKNAGIWWHHPGFKRIEAKLSEVLHLNESHLAKVSTTFFTFEMLKECACQPLINLANTINSERDFALYDPKLSWLKFESENKRSETQLTLCWIPFLLPAKSATQKKIHQLAQDIMAAVLPIVQEELGDKMSYVDAELFAPLPWWQSLDSAIKTFNTRRIDLVLSMLLSQGQETKSLKIIAEYRPDNLAYQLNFISESNENSAQISWLLVPNLAPDRALALRGIESYLKEAGITKLECKTSALH